MKKERISFIEANAKPLFRFSLVQIVLILALTLYCIFLNTNWTMWGLWLFLLSSTNVIFAVMATQELLLNWRRVNINYKQKQPL